jgi:hypothetical protein
MTPGIRETKEYGRWHLMRRKSLFRCLFLSLAAWGERDAPPAGLEKPRLRFSRSKQQQQRQVDSSRFRQAQAMS